MSYAVQVELRLVPTPGVGKAPFKSKPMRSSSHIGIEIAYYDIII